eukprot:TRINITY_DN1475_c0_g1_i1.p1 TRINITY_DN1475_c0_g1~~TRINITY_DN1475_c0_g1_i1.p1  ORF type:complete len:261 (-),score=85.00 TRINITY_DN1475_c0_g1_i1:231-1013(-)
MEQPPQHFDGNHPMQGGAQETEMEDDSQQIKPNQTIYINNLNERIKKEELRKSLYAMFSQFGIVLDVVALKTLTTRGQAFVAFKDVPAATNAMRAMQNFPFYDKPMRIQYAKKQSDIISKLSGTYVEKERRSRAEKRKAEEQIMAERREKKFAESGGVGRSKKSRSEGVSSSREPNLNPKVMPPNKILFVENLPDGVTEQMIHQLFQAYPGFKEVRMIPGKSGIAFVEFETEVEAGVAMNGLQHFKITPTNLMVISYAKK